MSGKLRDIIATGLIFVSSAFATNTTLVDSVASYFWPKIPRDETFEYWTFELPGVTIYPLLERTKQNDKIRLTIQFNWIQKTKTRSYRKQFSITDSLYDGTINSSVYLYDPEAATLYVDINKKTKPVLDDTYFYGLHVLNDIIHKKMSYDDWRKKLIDHLNKNVNSTNLKKK